MAIAAGGSAVNARTAILARVRAAERTAVLPDSHGFRPNDHSQPPALATADVLLRFERELGALGVDTHHADTPHAARCIVSELAGDRAVLSWDADALPHDVFSVLRAPVLGSAPRAEQAAAEIGITGCDAAIAETGSLVLLSGPGRSRTASLLPRTHLAIVRRDQVLPTLADAFERLREKMSTAASLTVITGPSRTADIELTLTLGIHGPARVVVVIAP